MQINNILNLLNSQSIKKNNMKEIVEKINSEFEAFKADAELQSEKGNKAAGTRARKSSLAIEKLLKEFRKVSLDESKK
ncbi:Histone H1-like protein Hc1 [Moheibacter sediminis]|uniref:Histone H1-like protein Hc1 n=2 Tax=Moheibacter sediminis TaxID=1434700 RepID=A0A1W1ZE07_9FLAO|nr:Histone H1-like protein Hc1 [Moheibacter sediminis]